MQCGMVLSLEKNTLAKEATELPFGKPVNYLEALTAKKLSAVIECAFNEWYGVRKDVYSVSNSCRVLFSGTVLEPAQCLWHKESPRENKS